MFLSYLWLTKGTTRLTKVTVCKPHRQLQFIAQYIGTWLLFSSLVELVYFKPFTQLDFFVFHVFFNIQLALSQPASQFCFDKQLLHTPALVQLSNQLQKNQICYLDGYNHVDTYNSLSVRSYQPFQLLQLANNPN